MKLKEQQKALIEARRGSIGMPLSATTPNKNVAGLSIWTSGAPSDASNGRNGSGEAHVHPATALPRMETMLSPRDGQARELPRPYPMSARPGLPPMIPPPTSGPRSAISPAAMPRPMPMSRNDFMRFFDQMYDQSEHAYHLVSTLNDQVRHSTSLLQTLQSSGVMIEGLVRTHFRELQTQMGEKFAIALTDLNRRMRKVEEKLDITPSPTSAQDLSERLRKMEDSVVIVVEKTKETAPKSAEPRD